MAVGPRVSIISYVRMPLVRDKSIRKLKKLKKLKRKRQVSLPTKPSSLSKKLSDDIERESQRIQIEQEGTGCKMISMYCYV